MKRLLVVMLLLPWVGLSEEDENQPRRRRRFSEKEEVAVARYGFEFSGDASVQSLNFKYRETALDGHLVMCDPAIENCTKKFDDAESVAAIGAGFKATALYRVYEIKDSMTLLAGFGIDYWSGSFESKSKLMSDKKKLSMTSFSIDFGSDGPLPWERVGWKFRLSQNYMLSGKETGSKEYTDKQTPYEKKIMRASFADIQLGMTYDLNSNVRLSVQGLSGGGAMDRTGHTKPGFEGIDDLVDDELIAYRYGIGASLTYLF